MVAAAQPVIDPRAILGAARPKAVRVWREAEPDAYTILEQQFAAWIDAITVAAKSFKEHVYDNKDLTDLDLRQHRQILYCSLWAGEKLAVDLLVLDQPNKRGAIQKYVILIDEKLAELRETLHSWHGAIEHQSDIPQSLKDSFEELNRGEVFPLDDVLEQAK